MTLGDAWLALRPRQWVKNGFVLVGPLFGHRWAGVELRAAALAFIVFCLASSAVYVYNDWIDRAADRRHPTKQRRPIAAGRISAGAAAALGLGALILAYAGAAAIGWPMVFLVSAYLGLNVMYSLWLKHVVIADVFAIACGFQLRLFAGTTGLNIPPSHWLLICGFALTLLLALGKRRAELIAQGEGGDSGATRQVLGVYSLPLVDQLIGICAALTLAGYSLYTISGETIATHGASDLPLTIPIATYGVFRYLHVLRLDQDGDPSRLLFADRQVLATAACWIAAVVLILR